MIEINNLTSIPVDKGFFKKIAKIILKKEKRDVLELSIALVSINKIKELNKKYRGKDKPTDVLSFSRLDFKNKKVNNKKNLGEVIICPQEIKKNAGKFKISFKEEMANCLIHGILHLLGYNHENFFKEVELMEKKQNYYSLKIFNKR